MKVLHTSDWHVGKSIRGRDRGAEHEAVLAEIAAVAADRAVDVVIVAGDLFDTAAPAPESERIVYRALLELAATGATVVVIAGNHDNERRLQAVAPVLGLGRIVTRHAFAKAEDGGVVTGTAADGSPWRLALVPFLSQRYVVKADDLMAKDADDHTAKYAGRVVKLCEALTAGFSPDAVNLVAAHLFVTGGAAGGGERDAHLANDYHVPAAAFPASTHYVALGHLHRSQRLAHGCPVHYCGSPLQLDFGETANEPSVNVVSAVPGAPAEVEVVPLRAGRRLHVVRGTLAELQLRAAAGDLPDGYLKVVVKEQRRAGLGDEVRALSDDVVDVVVDAPLEATAAVERAPRSGRSPQELFGAYLEERAAVDERVVALFSELLEESLAPDPA